MSIQQRKKDPEFKGNAGRLTEDAERALFNSIEVYFNRQRKHSTSRYKAPALFVEEWWQERKVA